MSKVELYGPEERNTYINRTLHANIFFSGKEAQIELLWGIFSQLNI